MSGIDYFLLFRCFFDIMAGDEEGDDEDYDGNDGKDDILVVLLDGLVQLVLGNDAVEIIAEDGKDGVPHSGTKGGVEQELPVVHARQTGRDGDEVADAGDETAGEGGGNTVVVEVTLGTLYLLLVEEAHLTPAAVGKLVDDGTADIKGYDIIDGGTDGGTNGGKEYDEEDVEVAGGGMIGCGGYDELGGYGDDGALKEHQNEDVGVGEVIKKPVHGES